MRPPPTPIESHAVVGTPGSILGAIKRRVLDLSRIAVFVLDEADAMLEVCGCFFLLGICRSP